MTYKKDKDLGLSIGCQLNMLGVETPIRKPIDVDARYNNRRRINLMLNDFGLDMTNDSLRETPRRVANMYLDELFYGLDYDNFPKCTTTSNEFGYDEMVNVGTIPIMSVCEHHLMPIDGYAKISYIPKDKVLGLSKFIRVADFFARRPQVQERLTEQIFHALVYILGTDSVAIQIVAKHYCMAFRGVKAPNSMTTTTKLGGSFKQPEVRAEFLNNK